MESKEIKIGNPIWYCCEEPDGSLRSFYQNEFGSKYAAGKGDKVIKVTLEFLDEEIESEPESGIVFSVFYIEGDERYHKNDIGYVWPSLIQVKMCHPGFWTKEIEEKELKFIRLKVIKTDGKTSRNRTKRWLRN